jgi:hypothetical protein
VDMSRCMNLGHLAVNPCSPVKASISVSVMVVLHHYMDRLHLGELMATQIMQKSPAFSRYPATEYHFKSRPPMFLTSTYILVFNAAPPFRFSNQKFVQVSHLSYECYVNYPSHFLLFEHTNSTSEIVQVLQLFNIQYSPTTSYYFSLRLNALLRILLYTTLM